MSDDKNVYVYRDALYIEDDNTLTEAEIQQMKQDRFDRWLAIVSNPNTLTVDETASANTGI